VLAAVPANQVPAPPRILWYDGSAAGQLLVEIRSTDRTGLLAVLTRVFEKANVDIVWAKVTTLGSSVDDVFCIVAPSIVNGDIDGLRAALEEDLLSVLPAPQAKKPAEQAG